MRKMGENDEMKMGKRAIYFTVDAMIAVSILFITLLLITSLKVVEKGNVEASIASSDVVRVFTMAKVGEVQNAYVQQLIIDGTIKKSNNTIFEQLGEFWSLGQYDLAQRFIANLSADLIPDQFGMMVVIDNEIVYTDNKSLTGSLATSKKIISGIAKDKPTNGFASRAFLTSINEKRVSSFAYFGGFVGQGNITLLFEDIPSGVDLKEMFLELDALDAFFLFINDIQCGATFSPLAGEMVAERWNITSCIGSIISGQKNNLTILFPKTLQDAYVGGGFAEVTYLTAVLNGQSNYALKTEWLPQIKGIINLYSSFYIPGSLNTMDGRLHYFISESNSTNYTLYLSIGEKTVLRIINATKEGTILFNGTNLSMLSYPALSQKTVPLRLGFENLSYVSVSDGNGDVALITDISGSMDWRMDIDNTNGVLRNCYDSQFTSPATRRISVAKCLDIQFVIDIINITGNKAGLISFSGTTQAASTVNPTTNLTLLNATIGTSVPLTGYDAGGATCICCGINSASAILSSSLGNKTMIEKGSSWFFTNNSFYIEPGVDPSGNDWNDITYANESKWFSGSAILGATNGYVYAPAVVKEMGANLAGYFLVADLWEHGADTEGPPDDFSSNILNSTANTYGIAGANDGWDWDTRNGAGPFGSDDDIDYDGVVGQKLSFDNNFGGAGNSCSGSDCSGAYGILINITPEMYTVIQGKGLAMLSFAYEWDDVAGNNFETADQVWIKGKWTSPTSGGHDLGAALDAGHSGADATVEIAAENNPNTDISGFYTADIAPWIEGGGMYYLEFGGKILANSNNEHGTWRFDDIQLLLINATNHYYLRKHFSITSLANASRGILNVLADDQAAVYLNGQLIDTEEKLHEGKYWNRHGKAIDGSRFVLGDNVIAVDLVNHNKSAKFDLKLIVLNDSREKAMMVMSDGAATEDAGCPQTGTFAEEAIEAACDAREDYGISVFSVGFGNSADNATMGAIAECGDGLFTQSTNISALQEFYKDVASSILSSSRHSETVDVVGYVGTSILYGDSYIRMNYTPAVVPPQFDEISLLFKQHNLQNCTFKVAIPQGVRVMDAKLTSYSSEHWTDFLSVNGNEVYNLSSYNADYSILGDPFVIAIPSSFLGSGNNTFILRTGNNPNNATGCSENNTFIYTGAVKASVPYSDVVSSADGCLWSVQKEGGTIQQLPIPGDYSGQNRCSYNETEVSYNNNDGTQVAAFHLFLNLDFDKNGKVNIDIGEQGLQIESLKVSEVPSLWGPTIAEVRVWQ